jgi:hypothetical protein
MILSILAFICICMLLVVLSAGMYYSPIPISIAYGFMMFAYLNELALNWNFSLNWSGI